jgi:hypothetical protein
VAARDPLARGPATVGDVAGGVALGARRGAARMSGRWELHFHGIPLVNQNSRGHWRQKAADIAQWRVLGALYAQSARIPPLPRVRLTATIYRRNLNVADEPGDWERLKPIIDGLVDAGVVPNDTRRYVEYGHCAEAHGKAGVVLVVEALEGAEGA